MGVHMDALRFYVADENSLPLLQAFNAPFLLKRNRLSNQRAWSIASVQAYLCFRKLLNWYTAPGSCSSDADNEAFIDTLFPSALPVSSINCNSPRCMEDYVRSIEAAAVQAAMYAGQNRNAEIMTDFALALRACQYTKDFASFKSPYEQPNPTNPVQPSGA